MTVNQKAAVPPTIRLAGAEDREAVARLIGEAFMDDPVSEWVFPDEEYRRTVHAPFFGVFLDAALRDGWVDVTDDHSAAALWLPVTGKAAEGAQGAGPGENAEAGDDGGADDDIARMLADVAGNERGGIVGQLTEAVHPTEPHYYLPIIGVHPGRQGSGLGGALLAHVTGRCDREGMPAYLEASNIRSKALYERLGFVFTGTTIDLPGGPSMWPMWREPRG